MLEPLAPDHLTAAMSQLPGWVHEREALTHTWRFADFSTAMTFMQDAAVEIDRLNHHPEWTNVYNRVSVRLTTHDAGDRVTSKDVELAKVLIWVAQRFMG